jgi:hypothetical protein
VLQDVLELVGDQLSRKVPLSPVPFVLASVI